MLELFRSLGLTALRCPSPIRNDVSCAVHDPGLWEDQRVVRAGRQWQRHDVSSREWRERREVGLGAEPAFAGETSTWSRSAIARVLNVTVRGKRHNRWRSAHFHPQSARIQSTLRDRELEAGPAGR